MLFNSYQFVLLFLPITTICFFVIRNEARAQILMIGAAVFFYCYWSTIFFALIFSGVVINYYLSRFLLTNTGPHRKMVLAAGIVINLIPLAYFKYVPFISENIDLIFQLDVTISYMVLPLAISFYTFQKIVLIVQSYRREVADVNFRSYLLFIIFFPHLIAGPITSAKELLPQFARRGTYRFNHDNFALGLTIFIVGLSKKALVADTVAVYATPVFQAAESGTAVSFLDAWVGVLAFTLQLYFDFSGYSDMAIGLARMFNITMPINFYSPYKSTSIIEFWRHWHMSLSWFLREHVYIPLGGNRCGLRRHLINLFATMLIAGIWHGAGWTFVIFGAIHGAALVVNVFWRAMERSLNTVAALGLTFITVVVGWVFFRAYSVAGAASILNAMFNPIHAVHHPGHPNPTAFVGIALLLLAIGVLPNTTQIFERWRLADSRLAAGPLWLTWNPSRKWAMVIAGLAIADLLKMQDYSEFLYFNF